MIIDQFRKQFRNNRKQFDYHHKFKRDIYVQIFKFMIKIKMIRIIII